MFVGFFSCHAFVFEHSSDPLSHFWHCLLNKPDKMPRNSLQLSFNTYINYRSSWRQWPILFGCCQTMTLLVVTRCYHSCLITTPVQTHACILFSKPVGKSSAAKKWLMEETGKEPCLGLQKPCGEQL